MQERFRDAEHVVRLGLLFLAAVAAFVVARALLVPEDFGRYGHYRAGALDDNRARVLTFAGRAACIECHSDVEDARAGGRHAVINCEACHGPLATHAADPTTAGVTLPEPRPLCLGCHEQNTAKPRGFPQIDPQDHADGGACTECHEPHSPGF